MLVPSVTSQCVLLLLVPLAAATSLDAGSHVLGGRPFRVLLPTSPASARAPVAILLHGLGDSGEIAEEMREVWPSLKSTHIVVGPDGPDSMWNVKGEYAENTPDDARYVGKTLIDHLATFSNVDATSFKIVGYSNGAALANRILIENDDPRITHSLTDGSQLNTYQYRGGTFYVGGASNQYVTTKASLTPRKVLQVVGGRDDVIPPEGGASSEIEDGEGGMLTFVPWQESALAIATAYGYIGAKAALSPDNPNFAKASYLSGQVVAVDLKKVGHVAGPFEAAKAVDLAAFLAPPPSAPSPSPSPSPSPPPSPSLSPSLSPPSPSPSPSPEANRTATLAVEFEDGAAPPPPPPYRAPWWDPNYRAPSAPPVPESRVETLSLAHITGIVLSAFAVCVLLVIACHCGRRAGYCGGAGESKAEVGGPACC